MIAAEIDPVTGAIIVALIAGIPASLAVVIGLLNRRDNAPAREQVTEIRDELRSPDANGNTLRDEIQVIERILNEHVRQTEEAITQLGGDREAVLEWIRRGMEIEHRRERDQ